VGFWDAFTSQFIDIIEWIDDDRNVIVHRYDRKNNEIKYGAKLIVREGQSAVFINEGQAQIHVSKQTFEAGDSFPPGTYTLTTQNLPILSTLKGWKYGFESPFKAEVYFISTTRFTDQKWGTPNPIMLRDPEFGPVRLRAFGAYSLRVKDAMTFLREIVGTTGRFTTEDIAAQLRHLIITQFTDCLGESKIPVLDLAANYEELGKFVTQRIGPEFGEYGLELDKFLVSNISLPPAVTEALDKRSSMGILGDLNRYAQYQAAEAIEKAAANPGMASDGFAMGAGLAMGQQMQNAFNAPHASSAPPPPPPQVLFHVAQNGQTIGPYDLGTLQQQVRSGTLTRASLVWKQGMAGWMPAGEVAELGGLFAAIPPPLPPAG